MAKKLKKALAMLLAVLMLTSTMSISAFAEETDPPADPWTYVEETNTYTLNENAAITSGMTVSNGATIVVNGDCSIAAGEGNAIVGEGALTITGTGKLTLSGYHGIEAASVAISDITVDFDATSCGIYVYNAAGDANATLTNVDGSISGGYAGVYVQGKCTEKTTSVTIDNCNLEAISTATSGSGQARKAGILAFVTGVYNMGTSISISNSELVTAGGDAGISCTNYAGGAENTASSFINIENSHVTAFGVSGTWSGIFASTTAEAEVADSIITVTDSTVYTESPNTGLLTSSQYGESKIILDNSILGASGKTALSMIEEDTAQVRTAELNNGSTYVQMTPDAVMLGEIVNHDGKTIIATAGDGITYNAENKYFVIPQGSAVTEAFTDGTVVEYTFNGQAGGVGGFEYEKEEIWGYDVFAAPVCRIVETGEEYETLSAAVADANALSTSTIEMLKSIDFDSDKALSITGDVTIIGDYTISRGDYTGTMFSVAKGATLTLDDGITFDGDNDWTFDSEGFYGDMEKGLVLSTGAKNSYTTSDGTEATAAMFSILSGGVVVMNDATIQNYWASNHNTAALFKIPAGAELTINDGALIKHIHGSVAGQVHGGWTVNGGKIADVYGHNTNGGVVDVRDSGVVTINGGEITEIRTLGLNANSNGILAQVYGENAKLYINGGDIHDNASFAPGNGWGSVVYLNRGGDFTMTGGSIKDTLSDHCTAFVANQETSIELLDGYMEVEASTAASFDSLIYGAVVIGEDMEIKIEEDALLVLLGDTDACTLDIDGEINDGTIWLMYGQPVTGKGTITSDVLIKADPSYFGTPGQVTITEATKWLDSLITVNSVGSDAYLKVEAGVEIDGVQVRVLGSVSSADYTNIAESKAEQAAAYIEETGATVESPVLYYHRLTADQKSEIVVTYDYNGGLDASGWSGCQITSGETFVPTAPAPTKDGLVLAGWVYAEDSNPESLSMDGTNAYNHEEISESVRLIAQWKKADYVCYIKETGVYYETLTAAVADANKLAGDNVIVMIEDIAFDSTKALEIKDNLTIISEPEHEEAHVISRGDYTGTLFNIAKNKSLTLDGGIVFDGDNNWEMDMDLYNKHLEEMSQQGISIYTSGMDRATQIDPYNTEKASQYFTPEEGAPVATAYMITVGNNATLNLKNVTIQNNYTPKSGLVNTSAGATVNLEGAQIKHCASVEGSGTVVNASGKITVNVKDSTLLDGNHVGGNHGLFRVYSGAVVNMSGGTISNTTGWNSNGVVIGLYGPGSTFNMSGGLITGNSSVFGADNGRNAAVYLHANSTMNMTGGTISFNNGRARGGIDTYKQSSTLNINRADQYFVDGVYPEESGAAAYTASNHPMIVDNYSRANNYNYDVGTSSGNYEHWWVTGGIYTQDVDEYCAEGYICIPYEDTERTDDYIVVPGYRVKYYAVEKNEVTNAETGEVTTEYTTTLLKKYFHLLPRDKFWYEMDERANYFELTDDKGGVIKTWYAEKELDNIYDFANTKLEGDLNLYGEFKYTDEAAVVLTIDMSGTMYRYKMGGKRYVDVAKAKALEFVNEYAAKVTNEGDKRLLAIARFDTDANVVLNWVDVATAEGLAAAKTAINGMKVKDNGSTSSNYVCTNFDAGVILTRNLLKQNAVSEISNKFAIILSDGAPTVTVNADTDTVGEIKSSFWGDQLDMNGKRYQIRRNGGGWTHPGEVDRTLKYLATGENNLADLTTSYGENKEGIFFVGVGGDMSVKLFNDAVYGTRNGSRTTDVKRKPAAFNYVEALQGIAQADILKMTTADWLTNLANKVGGTYVSANDATALAAEFNAILTEIVNS